MRYTVQDAWNNRNPSEYVTAIATAAKGCGQGNTKFAQVLHAFQSIDSELRHFGIDEPEENTSVQDFINLLNRKKVNWFNHYGQKDDKKQREWRDQRRNDQFQDQNCGQVERVNLRVGQNQGPYPNTHNYPVTTSCSPLGQISTPYGFNNQQRGYSQGFNQGLGYTQGYNSSTGQGYSQGGFPNNYQRYNRNNAYRYQQQQPLPQGASPAANVNVLLIPLATSPSVTNLPSQGS